MSLEAKRGIVTGGASGIGAQVCLTFADAGAAVVIADIDGKRGRALEAELVKLKCSCRFVDCDVLQPASVRNAVQVCLDTYGGLDYVINSAGVVISKSVQHLSLEEWDNVLDVNLRGTFLSVKLAIPYLRSSEDGAVVNISSTAGLVGFRQLSAYCASKGGVIALTRAMALELAPSKVRVNCVCPGSVDTPLMQQLLQQSRNKDAARDHSTDKTPLKRPALPSEIAPIVAFLADTLLSRRPSHEKSYSASARCV
jgi:NAD(P)-dependent dehydrogenase (short-subunit alcohol dehydrogenase family)